MAITLGTPAFASGSFAASRTVSVDLGSGADRALLLNVGNIGNITPGGTPISSAVIDPTGANITMTAGTERSGVTIWGQAGKSRTFHYAGAGMPTGTVNVVVTLSDGNGKPAVWALPLAGVTSISSPVDTTAFSTTPSSGSVSSATGNKVVGFISITGISDANAMTPSSPATLVDRVLITDCSELPGAIWVEDGAATVTLDGTVAGATPIWGMTTWSLAGAAPTGPTIDTQPTAQTTNEGSTATFTVSATASGGSLTYQWSRANPGSGSFSSVGGATSASYTTAATGCVADHGAQYRCAVTDSNGTTTSSAATLTVRSVSTTVRPALDITTAGWTASTGADFFALIDESSASDADYITSPSITGATAPVTLALAYPMNTGNWTWSVRAKTSSGTATMRVYLLNDAGTVVGTSADQTITSTYTTYSLAITISGPATRARVEVVT